MAQFLVICCLKLDLKHFNLIFQRSILCLNRICHNLCNMIELVASRIVVLHSLISVIIRSLHALLKITFLIL